MLSPADFEDLFPELFAPKAAADAKADPEAVHELPDPIPVMHWFNEDVLNPPLPQRHARPAGALRPDADARKPAPIGPDIRDRGRPVRAGDGDRVRVTA